MQDYPAKHSTTDKEGLHERWVIWALTFFVLCGIGWLVFVTVIARFIIGHV